MVKYMYTPPSASGAECVDFEVKSEMYGKTTCVVDINTLLLGREVFPCGSGEDHRLTVPQKLAILKLVKTKRDSVRYSSFTKTLKGWKESKYDDIEYYLAPGDEVDEALVGYFFGAVPPENKSPRYMQCGDSVCNATDTSGDAKPVYRTFAQIKGIWTYLGLCFSGGRENRIERRNSVLEMLIHSVINSLEE